MLNNFISSSMFKVELTTPLSEIDAILKREEERADQLTIRALAFLGEKCINEARDRAQDLSWYDQTGNLRSSIGYTVTHKGRVVHISGFKQVKQGSEGVKTGKDLALDLAKRVDSRFGLIVVAGMRYAIKVEAMENKVVLASAELFARRELPNMVKQLETQIAK